MIDRFFSSDSRSRIAALFCLGLFACQPPSRPSSNGLAPPDPEPSATSRQDVAPVTFESDETTSTSDHRILIAKQDDQRPPLRSESKPRARALLVTELQALKHLLAATPKGEPDRPQLLRRVAEDFVELEHVARDEGDEALRNKAQNEAISTYGELIADCPDYPKLDEAIYDIAVEYEERGDLANARRYYMTLVESEPASRFVPNAYLAFGEMFFDEAAQDPAKWDLALNAYQRVLRDPPPRNDVYGYAWYKLAWVLRNKGDLAGARDAFNQAITYATEYASTPGAAKLADASRTDLRSL
jgi:tetratricopeptide (TPR) repeat protein